jgi:hypothetical protein
VIEDACVEDARKWCEDTEAVGDTTQLSHVHGNEMGTRWESDWTSSSSDSFSTNRRHWRERR